MNARSLAPLAQTDVQRIKGIATLMVLGLVALLLAVGGAWLVAMGGSPCYLIAGVVVAVAAVVLRSQPQAALALYAALFFATLLWAVWEAGIDWWALAARMDLPFVLGALLLPWVNRPYPPTPPPSCR